MQAEIIITNAHVLTMDSGNPKAQAVAINGNTIARVGSIPEVTELQGQETKVIDAEGAVVMPGFVEAHAHIFPGAKSLGELDLQQTQGEEALAEALKKYASQNPDTDVLVGRSVNYGILGEGTRLTRADLDRIIADRPVFLRSGDYHNAWVNSAALEKADCVYGHDVGAGSEIVVGEDGKATGELREFAAKEFVLNRLTPPGRDNLGLAGTEPDNVTDADRASDKAMIKQGIDYCAALGITTIQNMDGNFYQCELLAELEQDGELNCRMEIPYHFLPKEPVENLQDASRMAEAYDSDMLWSGRIKMFMDGVLDAWTAVMLDDYADKPGERGSAFFTAEHFNAVCVEAEKRNLQVSVHAIGDGAVRMTLDGYQAAANERGSKDSRHRIEHIEVVHPQDISRFKELGVIASMQPIHVPGNGCFPKEPTIHMIGEQRWPYAYGWKTLKDAGAIVVYGTDWPVSPVDPLLSVKHALTREPWGPDDLDQRLSFDETLEAYTRVGAYTCFKEDKFGMLKEGMLADVVILDGTFPDRVTLGSHWPSVRMTICDGKITHTAHGHG